MMYGVSEDIAHQADADQAWREMVDSAKPDHIAPRAWWADDSVWELIYPDKERRANMAFVMRYMGWR